MNGSSNTALLELRGLSLSYRQQKQQTAQRAIDAVSFSIRAGETVGLIGASGSGKSSIARTILQLIKPDAGEILFAGRNIHAMTAQQLMSMRRRVQIIFQEPSASLSPRHNIGRILLEPLQHFAIGDPQSRLAKVKKTLHTVGLEEDILQRYPHQFSTGQQQRIAIARALVTDPDLLIADEAVASLDVSVQAQILQLFRSLQRDIGCAMLFISHDLGVIRQVADKVAVMYRGQLLEHADADLFFNQARHPYSQALLGYARMQNKIAPMPQDSPSDLPSANADGFSKCLYADVCADKMQVCERHTPKQHKIKTADGSSSVKCHLYGETQNNAN